jgi:hypothetical protein
MKSKRAKKAGMHSSLFYTTKAKTKRQAQRVTQTKKRSPPRTTQKRSPNTNGLLISNTLPYPVSFNRPDFDSAKGDVESEIAPIPIICLKKPVNEKWHFKDKVLEGYKLQDKLSKKHDFVCKIYQLIDKGGYFYSWQEAGVSLKKYLIDNPAKEQAKLAEASEIIKILYNTYKFVYNDRSVDNFIIINDKVKIIDFEQLEYKILTKDKINELNVTFTEADGKRSSPDKRNSTLPMQRTSSPPMQRTSTPRTSTPRTSTPRTSTPRTSTPPK